jgi:hypothetical protein
VSLLRKGTITRRAGKFVEKFECYIIGDSPTTWKSMYGSFWGGQTFTVGTTGHNYSFEVRKAVAKIFREGNPGNLTYSIRNVGADGKPAGGDLCSGTINGNALSSSPTWVDLPFSSPFTILKRSTKYALVLRAPSGGGLNYVGWREDVTSPTYAGGSAVDSDNSGSTWYVYTAYDKMFEIWGLRV